MLREFTMTYGSTTEFAKRRIVFSLGILMCEMKLVLHPVSLPLVIRK
jgi:hypothetical protein